MYLHKFSYILILIYLAACNLAPIFNKPSAEQYQSFKYQAFADSLANVPLDTTWWSYFNDTTLTKIIEKVSTNNNNLKAAHHNVERFRSFARVERSRLLPEINLSTSATGRVISQNSAQSFQSNKFINYDLRGLASYQIDLWGQLKNYYKASMINAEISLLEYYNLRMSLQAQAASLYMSIRQLDRQIALYDSTIVLRRESFRIATMNYQAGATDALDQARAETQLRTAESERWTFLNQRARLENALAILTGQEPVNFSLPVQPIDSLPVIFPTKIPSVVLQQRPDIWIALKSMEAENALIGAEKANLYPSITLNANAGYQGRELNNVLTPESFSWSLGGGLLQPIFNFGRNKAQLEAQKNRYLQVADLYQQSVLNAFKEVEDELANIYFLQNQYQRELETVASANRALNLARQRYEAGLVSYLEVVDAERTALLNQGDLVSIIGQLYQGVINLSLVTGGNFNPDIEMN